MKRDIDFDHELGADVLMAVDDMLFGGRRGYATVSGPAYDINTATRVYPSTSDRTCTCGDSCTCVGRAKPNVKFKDILDDVESVIFNEPATIVTFSDGSKVCVKACSKDTFNKETGLIYAIIKRLYANDNDENGYLRSRGLGEKMKKLLAKATDQKERERERRRKQKEKLEKKKKAEAENNAPNQTKEETKEPTLDTNP